MLRLSLLFITLLFAALFLAALLLAPEILRAADPATIEAKVTNNDAALAERKALFNILKWPQYCEDEFQEQFGPNTTEPGSTDSARVESYSLPDHRKVYEIQCGMVPHQASLVFMVQDKDGDPGRLLSFKRYDRLPDGKVETSQESHLIGLAEFDKDAGKLTILSIDRGAGDCGSEVVYNLLGEEPTVVAARAQYCRDIPQKVNSGPEKWPKVAKP
jgi:hypothetical protein